jgi:hypothetical protein
MKKKKMKGNIKNENLVGGFIPPTLFTYLTLYCLNTKESKSKIIRKALHQWWIKTQESHSMEDQIKLYIEQLQTDWEIQKIKNPDLSFQTFQKQVKDFLSQKNLDWDLIVGIIEKIKE